MEQIKDPDATPLEHDIAMRASLNVVGQSSGSSIDAMTLRQGNNTLVVRCCVRKDGAWIEGKKNVSVLVDTQAPETPILQSSNAVCSGKITLNVTAKDIGTGIDRYEYMVTYDGKTLVAGNATTQPITVNAPPAGAVEPRYNPDTSILWTTLSTKQVTLRVRQPMLHRFMKVRKMSAQPSPSSCSRNHYHSALHRRCRTRSELRQNEQAHAPGVRVGQMRRRTCALLQQVVRVTPTLVCGRRTKRLVSSARSLEELIVRSSESVIILHRQ
jgi:hypothetical protein